MSTRKNQFFKTTTLKQALKMGPRKFVKDYLFPAMRREHGNGFAMEVWHRNTAIYSPVGLDDINNRPAPVCNSVMCIGGTMEMVINYRADNIDMLAKVLGIPRLADDHNDAQTLFYPWAKNFGPWRGLSARFERAKTPATKERIAEKAVMAAIRAGEQLKKKSARQ